MMEAEEVTAGEQSLGRRESSCTGLNMLPDQGLTLSLSHTHQVNLMLNIHFSHSETKLHRTSPYTDHECSYNTSMPLTHSRFLTLVGKLPHTSLPQHDGPAQCCHLSVRRSSWDNKEAFWQQAVNKGRGLTLLLFVG